MNQNLYGTYKSQYVPMCHVEQIFNNEILILKIKNKILGRIYVDFGYLF